MRSCYLILLRTRDRPTWLRDFRFPPFRRKRGRMGHSSFSGDASAIKPCEANRSPPLAHILAGRTRVSALHWPLRCLPDFADFIGGLGHGRSRFALEGL